MLSTQLLTEQDTLPLCVTSTTLSFPSTSSISVSYTGSPSRRPRHSRHGPRQKVEIDVTMTSQGCPAHELILEKIKNRLAGLQQISQTSITLTWEPPWTTHRITPAARKQLGIE